MCSENFGCHFNLILHIMSDEAALEPRWQRMNLHIYAATNSVSLWDYSTNKLNCKTISQQFMV